MRKFINNQVDGRTVYLKPRGPKNPRDKRPQRDMPFDVALRKFRKAVERSGVLKDLRAKEFYEKPTAKRKRKASEGRKRWQKQISKDNAISNLPRGYRGRR